MIDREPAGGRPRGPGRGRRPWWAVALVTLAVAGCSGEGSAPGPAAGGSAASGTAPPRRGTIGVSLLTLENPFFRVIGDTITEEGRRRGYETLVLSADKDPARQAAQVRDFLVRGVVAIVLSPCESRAVVPAIQEANAAGVPVLTVDIPCREPGIQLVTQIATDNLGGGREAGRAMIEALGPRGGRVAILHFKQAESCRLRVQGFREVIDAHNASGGAKIEIVAELEGGAAKDLSHRAAEDLLQAHPDLAGIFAINDPSALGAATALEKAGRAEQVVLIGFDGQLEGKQAIRDGRIYADPIQFPDQMGREVVAAIEKHYLGEPLEPELLIPTRLYRRADAEQDPALR